MCSLLSLICMNRKWNLIARRMVNATRVGRCLSMRLLKLRVLFAWPECGPRFGLMTDICIAPLCNL